MLDHAKRFRDLKKIGPAVRNRRCGLNRGPAFAAVLRIDGGTVKGMWATRVLLALRIRGRLSV